MYTAQRQEAINHNTPTRDKTKGRKHPLKKQDFCCVDNFSVLIPYRELEKLLQSATKLEQMEQAIKRTDERCAKMQMLYCEVLEKVAEINRYL